MSSCRSYSRAKGPGTSAGAFPMALSLSGEGPRGSSTGCEGVLWDPRDPLPSQPCARRGWPIFSRLYGGCMVVLKVRTRGFAAPRRRREGAASLVDGIYMYGGCMVVLKLGPLELAALYAQASPTSSTTPGGTTATASGSGDCSGWRTTWGCRWLPWCAGTHAGPAPRIPRAHRGLPWSWAPRPPASPRWQSHFHAPLYR